LNSGTSFCTLTGITPNHHIITRPHSTRVLRSFKEVRSGPAWTKCSPQFVTQPLQATLETERTGFAMIVCWGLDIKISKHVAFRRVGADYTT
jgi:hypothetical protein